MHGFRQKVHHNPTGNSPYPIHYAQQIPSWFLYDKYTYRPTHKQATRHWVQFIFKLDRKVPLRVRVHSLRTCSSHKKIIKLNEILSKYKKKIVTGGTLT